MQNISISRFKPGELTAIAIAVDNDGNEIARETFDPHGCIIEGSRDDGTRWAVWVAPDGSPQYFYPYRADDGTVSGDMIDMQPAA